MFDFVTVGSATKDSFIFLDKVSLKPGVNRHFLEIPTDKKIDVNKVLEFSGGSATNAAASFASFNKKSSVISKIGNDEYGKFVLSDLKKFGINTDLIKIEKGETPFSDIIVSSEGSMILLVHRGIESTLSIDEINKDFDSKWLYIGPLPQKNISFLTKLLEFADKKHMKTVFNPGSVELNLKLKKMEPLLKYVDIISMNDEEAKKFVGYSNDVNNISKLAKYVKETAIITKGEKGSLVLSDKKLYIANTFKAKQINFIGAGDAFLSGFVNAMDDGKDIEDGINLASFNALNVIQKYGAKSGLIGEYPPENMRLRIVKSTISI
ncbi:MAG: PfkB domain protein [Candidatus Parvarchaeum acidophilus ARMAN-5]|jgi:sugar/nucleoside kinase (ribokinase family)|uniref:PfkB domain protein n=1 Tax=Candidatus Parvarchaeum acidophilus ARMAN-5 TaxID=662762 RepID=D6GVC1_PARA5|nr:MAG: PfkB domain protein [Candidatus Parvarchaeum acidophilus ARMAN-5]